jgi:phage terminase large subunit-like protein
VTAAPVWQPTYYLGYGAEVARFMENWIVQTKGRWAGQPIRLEPWQHDWLGEAFLERSTPTGGIELVYREAMLGIARKNGKSTLSSGIALHGLLATGENSPEVYAAAASTEQARIVFDQAKRFVEGSPKLQDWLKPYRSVIECEANGGIFRVLSADGPLQHGLNPSLVVIDELWAHKNPELYYALTTGQGARENPLIVDVTTAGFDRKTVCHHVFEHGQRLQRAGLHAMREERFFFQWFAAEQGANIEDRDQWLKANPSSWIDIDGLERERKRLPRTCSGACT